MNNPYETDNTKLFDSTVSADNFATTNEEVRKSHSLAEARNKKLENLNRKNQNASLDNSYTELEDGRLESNRNKIWNDLGDAEYQDVFDYGINKNTLTRDEEGRTFFADGTPYNGRTRRLYMFGTKDDNNDQVKFGLARGDLEGSESRYLPEEKNDLFSSLGMRRTYGWESGSLGVDTNKKELDVLLPDNVATMLEGLAHGRNRALEGRVVKDRYEDPDLVDQYGSGSSEYYSNREALFGKDSPFNEEQGKEIFNRYLSEMQQNNPRGGIADKDLELQNIKQRAKEFEVRNSGIFDRAKNTAAGFGTTFLSELIINPLDAIGDLTGLYDLGTEAEKSNYMADLTGYNSLYVEQGMEEIGKQWDVIVDKDASNADKLRAVKNGVVEAFLNPEMLGTSLGAILSWVTPGAVLKVAGVGAKAAQSARAVDRMVRAGTINKTTGKLLKLKKIGSIDGATDLLAKQSGYLWSAMGNVNNQYEQFVENNNGVELEGAEKAAWFAKTLPLQVFNQNIDKIVDLKLLKSPGVLTTLVPAVKQMTNKEFSKALRMMGKGVAVTAGMGGLEAVQEYAQTTMELVNSRMGSEKFNDVETFIEFISDERNTSEAGVAMLAGAGGSGQFQVAGAAGGAFKGILNSKDGLEKIKKVFEPKVKSTSETQVDLFTPQVDEIETTEEIAERSENLKQKSLNTANSYMTMLTSAEEEVMAVLRAEDAEVDTPKIRQILKEKVTDVGKALKEINEAEINADTDNSKKVLRKIKKELLLNEISSDSVTELGSGFKAEDVLEEYLQLNNVTSENTTESEQKLLQNYINKNNIPEFRFKGVSSDSKKNAMIVYSESLGEGKESASTLRNNLKTTLYTPGVSKVVVAESVGNINRFINTQEKRKDKYDSVLNEMEGKINDFNKTIVKGKPLTAAQELLKTQLKKGKNVKGVLQADNKKEAFVSVSSIEGSNKLQISPNSLAVSKSIEDTISYLTRTKNIYETEIASFIKDYKTESSNNSEGLIIRPNKKNREARKIDEGFYKKRKVTKVILDENEFSPKWGKNGDYYSDNLNRINQKEYNENDVVVINTTAAKPERNNALRKQIQAVRDAKGTIVIDDGIRNQAPIRAFLKRNQLAGVTVDGYLIFTTKEKAEAIRNDKKAKEVNTAQENRIRKNLITAFQMQEDSKALTKDEKVFYDDAIEKALPLFGNDIEKAKRHFETQKKNLVSSMADELVETAVNKGKDSAEYSAVLEEVEAESKKDNFHKKSAESAKVEAEARLAKIEKGTENLVEWKKAEEESKIGNVPFSKWVKNNVSNARAVVKDMLKNSFSGDFSKEGRVIYAYKDPKDPEGSDFKIKLRKDRLPKNEKGDFLPYQVIEVDPEKFVLVSQDTVFNSYTAEELKTSTTNNEYLNNLINTAKSILEKTVKGVNKEQLSSSGYIDLADFANSVSTGLLMDKDGKYNENMAVVLSLAGKNFIRNNNYLLSKNKKSKKDIAELIGKDESEITTEAMTLLQDKGMSYKTAANSVGKDVAMMLGISFNREADVDAQTFDSLVSDLGQIALLMAGQEGLLKIDNDMAASTYANKVLGKKNVTLTNDEGPKIAFVTLVENEEKIEDVVQNMKEVNEILPNMDSSRKEPSFKPISQEVKDKATSKMRKEKLGTKLAEGTKKVMNILMDTEWVADLDLMRDMIENKDLIKVRLGFIEEDSEKFKTLSFEEKQSQPSINRDIEKNFEHLEWVVGKNKDSSKVSMYFKYFLSKNGRFFIDSNTLQPQNNKHLDRFAIQPKSHEYEYIINSKKRFIVNGEDVSENVYYALAQAFGMATDKVDPDKIENFSKNILAKLNTPERIKEAKDKFLKGEEYLGIEMEHLGHALQGFKFLEGVASKKPFKSSISAEFDAITSGFGIKLLQMPILKKVGLDKWLVKVGFIKRSFGYEKEFGDSFSMNDLLDKGGLLDSYKQLAFGMDKEKFTFAKITKENSKITKSDYNKKLWDSLLEVLPGKDADGLVKNELRKLFKYPFMTFNYSASIKNIRENLLTGEMIKSLSSQMAKVDLTKVEDPVVKLMQSFLGKKGSLKSLQEDIRNKNIYSIKNSAGKSFGLTLKQMVDASYGARVEEILTSEFSEFVEAQNTINDSFKAMFEVFFIKLEQEFEKARSKSGFISVKKEREIYESLKEQYPMIRGPLSNIEDEMDTGGNIGIYAMETSSPYGYMAGRKAGRINLTPEASKKLGLEKTIRVSAMTKQMAAAISAGSVIPIHFVDGAQMSNTISDLDDDGVKGIVSVHDAIIPPLHDKGKAQKSYNKQTIDVNVKYSFVNEIAKSIINIEKSIDFSDEAYSKKKMQINQNGKYTEVSLKNYFYISLNNSLELANDVNLGREKLIASFNEGAKIMHLVGTADGVYEIEKGSLEYTKPETYTRINNPATKETVKKAKSLNTEAAKKCG